MKSLINFVGLSLKLGFLPIIVYCAFFVIRISGAQPDSESGLGDFITAYNFILGSSMAFLVHLMITLKFIPSNSKRFDLFWPFICFMLSFLAFDEVFMIHENIGKSLHTTDTKIMLVYGMVLFSILLMNLRKLPKASMIGILLFFTCGLTSVISDYFFGEGYIVIIGFEFDIEQYAESIGALSLTIYILSEAVHRLYLKGLILKIA
jgi:hypothetical protein